MRKGWDERSEKREMREERDKRLKWQTNLNGV